MKKVTFGVVVVAVVLLSGCTTFGGSPIPDGTVTAVDVPDVEPSATSTSPSTSTLAGRECLAPRPETPTSPTPTAPDRVVALPGDGLVDGSALVDLHVDAITDHSYRLHVNDRTVVSAIPAVAAFNYEGVDLGVSATWAYAVGGRLYTLDGEAEDLVFGTEPYRVGSRTYERYRSSLTGRYWLVQRVGFYEYRVVDTRSWNGTTVRVLRDTVDQPTVLGPDDAGRGEYVLNSTVYVDRRGIIRHVSHVREYEYDRISGLPNRTEVDTFGVEDVGRAQVHRPSAFCVTNPSAVRTKDVAGPGNSTAGPTGTDASTTADPTGHTTGRGVSSPGHNQTATDVTG